MVNLVRLDRSFWKPVLVGFLCGMSMACVADRTDAQSTAQSSVGSRKRIQQIIADRKALIVELKTFSQTTLQRLNRIEALWKQGAVSEAQYRQAQWDVTNTQQQLNRLICDDLVSTEIYILMVQLRSAISQKKRYQVLLSAGAISHMEFLNVKEKADMLQENLDEAIEDDPVSKKHINKAKECRDWR